MRQKDSHLARPFLIGRGYRAKRPRFGASHLAKSSVATPDSSASFNISRVCSIISGVTDTELIPHSTLAENHIVHIAAEVPRRNPHGRPQRPAQADGHQRDYRENPATVADSGQDVRDQLVSTLRVRPPTSKGAD